MSGFDRLDTRFIPACAGNSSPATSSSPATPVHPRVCGELVGLVGGLSSRPRFIPACAGNSVVGFSSPPKNCGSSPRVRGTRQGGSQRRPQDRFIPACAGNSEARTAWASMRPVHPRVCGELNADKLADLWLGGSSPRVRGTRKHSPIPTTPTAVHPRVCGELSLERVTHQSCPGSSPRVRGTRINQGTGHAAHRFIPACAGNSADAALTSAKAAVHPRVCGELGERHHVRAQRHGSSPRVRGTPRPVVPSVPAARFIPACAGNSSTWQRTRETPSVHPRVCGELDRFPPDPHGLPGSSPRVRGTRVFEQVQNVFQRFIPACAGNSALPLAAVYASSVHPRVCGELLESVSPHRRDVGSSPRVRGTRKVQRGRWRPHRFIPACAGNSMVAADSPAASAVHPRVCGELLGGHHQVVDCHGSSPRVRGTLRAGPIHDGRGRFIPACAGNSAAPPSAAPRSTVHPRVCGELSRRHVDAAHGPGSSPRVRGTRRAQFRPRRRRRFIPACAGNSTALQASARWPAVHPRVCGELPIQAPPCPLFDGSSPRVRGTLYERDRARDLLRFIPACAGNSSTRCATALA